MSLSLFPPCYISSSYSDDLTVWYWSI